jgi:hypothetical protein
MAITVGGSPPPGMVGDAYATELTAVGGTAPYTWTSNPPLPNGLNLQPLPGGEQAMISGTPTTDGSTKCTINVTDSQNVTVLYDIYLKYQSSTGHINAQ